MKRIFVAGLLTAGLGLMSMGAVNAQSVSSKDCKMECCAGKKDVKAYTHSKEMKAHEPSKVTFKAYALPQGSKQVREEIAYERYLALNDPKRIAKERTYELNKKLDLTPSQERKAIRLYKKEARKEIDLRNLRHENRTIMKDELTREQWNRFKGLRGFGR